MINVNKKLKSNQLVKSRMNSLASFSDIKHRLEIVKTANDITWINDSKSTDAEATAFSLENLEGPIIWLVGFSENKRNLDLVNELAINKVNEIICFGNFETELKYYFAAKIKYGYKKYLSDAIRLAVQNAKPGYSVLFSPACSSFLNYENYKQRGDYFKELVNSII